MDSAYLLIIDNSPDHAQVINSFLRNAGVAVRVVNTSNFSELENALKEKSPFLILIGTQLPPAVKISQILQAAAAKEYHWRLLTVGPVQLVWMAVH